MFYNDHAPPHFHAEYQGERGTFGFQGDPLDGGIRSRTALRLIKEWAELHRAELEDDWDRARTGRPLEYIEPLH